MSLCSTYVEAIDGNFYRDPTFHGDTWFLCFDDDDPPELVVMGRVKVHEAEVILRNAGIQFNRVSRDHVSGRQFGWWNGGMGRMHEATSFWVDLSGPIPVPKDHTPVKDIRKYTGVIYSWTEAACH